MPSPLAEKPPHACLCRASEAARKIPKGFPLIKKTPQASLSRLYMQHKMISLFHGFDRDGHHICGFFVAGLLMIIRYYYTEHVEYFQAA
jgi:hypothetical protein